MLLRLATLLGGDRIACGRTVTTAGSLCCRPSLLERIVVGAVYRTASWAEAPAILLDAVEAKQTDLIPAQGIQKEYATKAGLL